MIRFHFDQNKILELKFQTITLKKKVAVNVSNDRTNYFKSGEVKHLLSFKKNDNEKNALKRRLFEKNVKNVIQTKLTKKESKEILRILPQLQEIEKNV